MPWSEDQIGNLPQAGTGLARVGSVQRVKASGELQARMGSAGHRHEGPDCVNAGLEVGIIRQVEMQGNRAG